MRPLFPLLAGLMVACSGSDTSGTVPDDDGPTDTGGPTDDPTDGPTDSTDGPTDTGTTPPDVLEVTNASWALSPYMGTVVEVTWDQNRTEDVAVEYSFDPGEWLSTPTIEAVAGTNTATVVGIPFATDADWRIVGESATVDVSDPITTGPRPPELRPARLISEDPANQWADGNYLLSSVNDNGCGWCGGDYHVFIMDRKGRIVWAKKAPQMHWILFASLSKDGTHFLWDESTYWSSFGNGSDSVIHRTYLDAEIEVVPTPGLHHAWVELPDGTLAWGSKAHGGGEALVEKAPGAPDETVLWTCDDDWPGSQPGWQECESNGIYYDAASNSFIYSFYTNSSIVEVDRASGSSVWWAGTVPGGYDFVPTDSQFSWQHGISWTDSGTLLVSTESYYSPVTTMVREYVVDRKNGTLTDVWNYDSEIRANTNGQAWRLDNGNTLHIIGSSGHLKEVTDQGVTVWEVSFLDKADFDGPLLGGGEFITDLYTLLAPEGGTKSTGSTE